MDSVKALFFDVGGTVFDWKNTVRDEIDRLAREHGHAVDSEAFANDWRAAMFRVHGQVRQGDLP
jgi:2-haloacid dehalogenase